REARFDDVVVEQDMSREEVINRLGQPHLHSAGVSDRLEDIMSQLEGNDAQLLRDASHTVGLVRRAGLAQLYAPPTAALDMLSNSDRYS
ncbi:MAG TPA: hypothetical protein VK983_00595, partial [Candidatus Limnocylindrales bacterium]|nr:hypothetical protein [Candidatus Limnocylindrales bacterium]